MHNDRFPQKFLFLKFKFLIEIPIQCVDTQIPEATAFESFLVLVSELFSFAILGGRVAVDGAECGRTHWNTIDVLSIINPEQSLYVELSFIPQ